MVRAFGRARRVARRVARTGTSLARDRRLPLVLRCALVVGLAPIPGPFDNALLVIAVAVVWVWHRSVLAETWAATAGDA